MPLNQALTVIYAKHFIKILEQLRAVVSSLGKMLHKARSQVPPITACTRCLSSSPALLVMNTSVGFDVDFGCR